MYRNERAESLRLTKSSHYIVALVVSVELWVRSQCVGILARNCDEISF